MSALQTSALHTARVHSLEEQLHEAKKAASLLQVRMAQAESEHELAALQLQARVGTLEASLDAARLREAASEQGLQALRGELQLQAAEGDELKVGHAHMGHALSAQMHIRKAEPLSAFTLLPNMQAKLAVLRSEAASSTARAEESAANADLERCLRMQVRVSLRMFYAPCALVMR
jgi:hypothetical protein